MIAMKNIEQSHIALLIRMATEAVAGYRVQWQWAAGDSWQMVGSWAATTGGQGAGGCVVLKFY